MATRTLTGTIHQPDGAPWPDFPVEFTVKPGTFTDSATYPPQSVTTTTGADGTFTVALETEITYQVGLRGAFLASGTSTRYPAGSLFDVVVPAGSGAVTLETVRAASETPVTPSILGRIETLETAVTAIDGGSPDSSYGGGA